ncbi:MAG: branched-chain amino acid ABC transporter substrate-binding protein [Acidovorax sp.]|uniref:branched-chain amino acid ABC transporter substrate-binding protein n=1 Tax=Acidovorax sp. TaxID=1872122 RepID=UPI00260285F2|nr:branched-chain amino acid ABC transporter substrate-binding protein [Acidovorax sp.]MDH4425685.1 branched-chain amino acid ABC transporter substrate-binding protein [Acidovorax sp.]MDH4447298.1 branched-chain amino acid ABC transporter substrate-binding protein [Acidovorax sp.]MDH4464813.1 branched-chain amino acid ABC transporter substrate-binding protein [Acidovorax sp.]
MNQPIDRRGFTASMAVLAVAAATFLSGCGKVPDTIKIGVAQPLSGPLGALGQDLLNGVNLAVEELNKGAYTVDGKRVTLEVVAVDDKADAATGKAVAQQLVDAGVVAVIGHLNSGVSIETAPIYAAKGIAQIAISTNPKFTQLGLPTTFRMVANDNLQARAIGSFAATQLGAARYAALDDGTPYGKGLADGAAEQLKAEKKEVLIRKSFDDKTVAFDELAAELKAAKVEVIVSTLNDFQALALLEALRKIDYTKISLLGGDTIKTTDMTKAMGMVEGVYATSPVLEAKEFSTGKPFLEKYVAAYKKPPAYGGHYSYDSMYVLSAAIQKAKSADPKEITKAMSSINGYAPVIGTMTWDAKGEQRYGAVGVYELRAGSWELRMRSDRW